ncbi:MAG: hypothetical protein JSS61_06050 [Verrucomicrobia bacterium]|nr:hypothetical protein [Verrucomicrobiota bacterium]
MILKSLQQLSLEEKKSLLERMVKLQEEVGELAQEVLIQHGSSGSHYKQSASTIREEAVDVILVALSIFYLEKGTPEELDSLLAAKAKKWKEKQS